MARPVTCDPSLSPDGFDAVERAISVDYKFDGAPPADVCSSAIAACEVIAAIQGRAAPNLPQEIVKHAKKLRVKPSESLRSQSRAVFDKILTDSKLKKFWSGSKDWHKIVRSLQDRI
jgi:hypothetical protein